MKRSTGKELKHVSLHRAHRHTEHVTQAWPIKVAHAPGYCALCRDGRVTKLDPIKVNLRTFEEAPK